LMDEDRLRLSTQVGGVSRNPRKFRLAAVNSKSS
jgi:hypothetical protein